MASPWGPDALSTSTAELTMDASRLSIRASPEGAREHAQMCTSTYAPRTSSPCHPSHLPLLHHLLALLFLSFQLHIHSLLTTSTKDSWEGDGVSCEMTVDPFMTNAPRWSPQKPFFNMSSSISQGGIIKKGERKNSQNSSVKALTCCVGSWSPWHDKPRLLQLPKRIRNSFKNEF